MCSFYNRFTEFLRAPRVTSQAFRSESVRSPRLTDAMLGRLYDTTCSHDRSSLPVRAIDREIQKSLV